MSAHTFNSTESRDDMDPVTFALFVIAFFLFIAAIFVAMFGGFWIIHHTPFQDGFPNLTSILV